MRTAIFICVIATVCLILSGCGAMNTTYGGMITQGVQDYAGAKANIQKTDDLKLQAWVDTACAVNVGALQRAVSTTGNQSIANAVFTACPVPGVGVTSNGPTGSMQVQTFEMPSVRQALQVAQPAQQPVPAPLQPAPVASAAAVAAPPPKIQRRSQTAPRTHATFQPVIQPAISPAPASTMQPIQTAPATQPAPVQQPATGLPQGAAFP